MHVPRACFRIDLQHNFLEQRMMRQLGRTSRSFLVRPRDSTGKRRSMRKRRPPYTMKPPAAATLTTARNMHPATRPTSVASPVARAVNTHNPACNTAHHEVLQLVQGSSDLRYEINNRVCLCQQV